MATYSPNQNHWDDGNKLKDVGMDPNKGSMDSVSGIDDPPQAKDNGKTLWDNNN
jgi:hypothetical protein